MNVDTMPRTLSKNLKTIIHSKLYFIRLNIFISSVRCKLYTVKCNAHYNLHARHIGATMN